jgi:hypothetical protein
MKSFPPVTAGNGNGKENNTAVSECSDESK